MTELVKSWKKFGRSPMLVDRNTKNTLEHREIVDPIDEAICLFKGWLHHPLSLHLMVMFISSGFIGALALTFTPTFEGDYWTDVLAIIPLTLIFTMTTWSLIASWYLFPFKWDLLSPALQVAVYRNLPWMNVCLLIGIIASLYVSLTSLTGIIASLLMFSLYMKTGLFWDRIWEEIRDGK